jgi:hypothetical protein
MIDNQSQKVTRRIFLGNTVAIVGVAWLGAMLPRTVPAQELKHVSESDPPALALGYREDAATVDGAKYPRHEPGQMCANCKFFQGVAAAEYGPCQLYPGKAVHARGWCSGYTAKT